MTAPTTSVVITTFNRRESLEEILQPLLDDPGADEIVVVVDGCQDGSLELLEAMAQRWPKLRPVMPETNVGQPRARRLGFERARGDVVLSLDDDVLAEPGLVSGHRAAHAGRESAVVLGYMPTNVPAESRPGLFATREYAQAYEDQCQLYDQDPSLVFRNFWAGNFSIRRSDFLASVDDYDFPLVYHEDRDLGLRFRDLGLEPVFDRSLRAVHQHEKGFDSYVREAESAGRGAQLLHALHPQALGPFNVDAALEVYPPSVRLLVVASDRPRIRRLALLALKAAVWVAATAERYDLEFRLARVAKVLKIRHGARAAIPDAHRLASAGR